LIVDTSVDRAAERAFELQEIETHKSRGTGDR